MSIRETLQDAYALLPAKMNSPEATLLLLAIQRQEDPQQLRYQKVARTAKTLPENVVSADWAKGPARGLLQFEQGGGVKGVIGHPSAWRQAQAVCQARGVLFSAGAIWRTLETDDVLALALGRLLLWTDSGKLPEIGEEQQAFDCYLRTWRPGAWSRGDAAQRTALRQKWARNYAAALNELQQPA